MDAAQGQRDGPCCGSLRPTGWSDYWVGARWEEQVGAESRRSPATLLVDSGRSKPERSETGRQELRAGAAGSGKGAVGSSDGQGGGGRGRWRGSQLSAAVELGDEKMRTGREDGNKRQRGDNDLRGVAIWT